VTVIDALGRAVTPRARPVRVVSLVPSETESVVALAGRARLVGRTRFCEEPASVRDAAIVGGTKDVDVAQVIALAPDLVLANQEENGRRDVEALIAAGLTVHVSFPRTLRGSADYLVSLCHLVGRDPAGAPEVGEAEAAAAAADRSTGVGPRVFVPIWKDPWMTFDDRTFASDVLRAAGATNPFAGRPRRYPLAADLDADREAIDAGSRDTRYPRVTLEEVEARAPEVVLLPDEPYAFGDAERAELAARSMPAARAGAIHLVSGKDLFWYGVRAAAGVRRLRALLASASDEPVRG
jgi:ABC-type Fe3+-hydroxamate transport system substrate-binding protein